MKCFFSSIVVALFWQSALYALTYDKGLPEVIKGAIQTDFSFVQTIQGTDATQRHARIYGAVSGDDYMSFFNDRIEQIRYAGDQGPSVIAFVRPIEPHTMWLSDGLTNYHAAQAWRVATLWHESRHSETENGNWSHVRCPKNLKDQNGDLLRGPLSHVLLGGQPACDDTADGAYGATATMMGNLSLYCSNCSEKLKADAELIFEDGVNRLTHESLRRELLGDLGR